MTEPQTTTQDVPQAIEEQRNYIDVLRGLVGKQVTVVNPESYEALPAGGSELREGSYSGQITGFGNDYFIFETNLAATNLVELVAEANVRVGRAATQGVGEGKPVQQFIPIARIKRLSLVDEAALLHLSPAEIGGLPRDHARGSSGISLAPSDGMRADGGIAACLQRTTRGSC